jgi:hypothetical protein
LPHRGCNMRTATPATGRPSQSSGKNVACAPAALPRIAFSTISNRNKTAFKNPRNPMKTKAAPLSNRNTNPASAPSPQPAAPASAHCAIGAGGDSTSHRSRIAVYVQHPPVTIHEPRISRDPTSNRHTVRLENAISDSKQRMAVSSNRHFFRVSSCDNFVAPVLQDSASPHVAQSRARWFGILAVANGNTETTVSICNPTVARVSNRYKPASAARANRRDETLPGAGVDLAFRRSLICSLWWILHRERADRLPLPNCREGR